MLIPWPLQKNWFFLPFTILATMLIFGFALFSNLDKNQFATTSIHTNINDGTPNRFLSDLKSKAMSQNKLEKKLKTESNESFASNNVSFTFPVYNGTVEDYYEEGFLTELNICSSLGAELKLLIIVTSAPNHNDARLSIRETWGSFCKRNDIDLAFLLGSSNETVNEIIRQEHDLYGDIIRGSFVDSYDNLTLKTMAMHEWVSSYCSKAKFVLKTDDDMFIHVSKLLTFINLLDPTKDTLYGRVVKKWKPVRSHSSKYFLSTEQYKESTFPDFTTGPAYLFPSQLSEKLFSAALNRTYVKLEDVFFNGVLAQDMNIPRKNNNQFMNRWVRTTPCAIQKVISVHPVTVSQQYLFWKLVHETTNCTKTKKGN